MESEKGENLVPKASGDIGTRWVKEKQMCVLECYKII